MRGWGPADFEAAGPEFLEAVHLALFAEALAPEIVKTREILALEMGGLDAKTKATIVKAKVEAPARLAGLRALLGLDAEDGRG